jgi:hypothetical protein
VGTTDCDFCDYPILAEVETNQQEEFYLPDRRYESDKEDGASTRSRCITMLGQAATDVS